MKDIIIRENDTSLDANLVPMLELARRNPLEMHRLALDCTRLLRESQDHLETMKNQGFVKRLWDLFSGQRTQVRLANQQAFVFVQRMSLRYLELLNEQNLMTLNALATIKNQLSYAVSSITDFRQATGEAIQDVYKTMEESHSATAEQIERLRESTKAAIMSLAMKMKQRLEDMERRIERLEQSSAIHGWLLTFDEFGYERYPRTVRLLKIVSHYRMLKNDSWNADDVRYLKSALRRGGLDPDEHILIRDFLQQLAIENYPDTYGKDICQFLRVPEVDPNKVLYHVSLPALNALYLFAKEYEVNKANIERLARRMPNMDPRKELSFQITDILDESGLETYACTERHHFAMELLTGVEIAERYGWASGYQCQDPDCEGRRKSYRNDSPGFCPYCGKNLTKVLL